MAHPNPKNKRERDVDRLAGGTAVIGLDDLIDLLNSPKRLGLMRLYSGFMSGIGATIGAALVIFLLTLAVKHLGGVPWIGDLLRQVSSAAHGTGK